MLNGRRCAAQACALVDALLRLGDIDYQAVGLADFGRPDGFHQRQVSRWLAHLDSVKDYPGWPGASSLPGLARLANWLSDHCPQQFEAGIQHGDFHLSNVMFRHDCGELAAVVDWELATIGDPLLDLAWLVVTWPCADGRVPAPSKCIPGTALQQRRTGRPLPRRQLALVGGLRPGT